MHQLDINNAFFNGSLIDEVYMRQLQNFIHHQFPSYVCKLQKESFELK